MQVFGIRHHGPGSARSLRQALAAMQPDILLVEGPPEGDGVISLIAHNQMQPPVALLIYAPDALKWAAYYPFARFSPEWQAIQYGLSQNIPVRFMDLPQTHQFAQQKAIEAAQAATDFPQMLSEPTGENPVNLSSPDSEAAPAVPEIADDVDGKQPRDMTSPLIHKIRRDPLSWLAEAAGYTDGERWWEHIVEQRQDGTDLFAAILEAMTALRTEVDAVDPPALNHPQNRREAQREAYMRRVIRQAQKEGFENIAVVCGAWHAPVLNTTPAVKQDNALLKGLPKLKVKATWVPWSYGRLSYTSGYGAGVESPGWYHHLWHHGDQIAIRWMTQVAQLLRQEDIDASSASVIEAVRLAESLAALRDRPLPSLDELNEATQAVLCFGDRAPMRLIHDKLIVGDRLGIVPEDAPIVPLQQDLQALQKRLRLKPEASEKLLELDLRKENDLARSHLLHRLTILKIAWGIPNHTSSTGTFREGWRLCWEPEFAIAIIEASRWGNTVETAATAFAITQAESSSDLPTLTALLDQVLLAELTEAMPLLMRQLQAIATVASDIAHLMAALPTLANILRYSNVRQTDSAIVRPVVHGLVLRICIGLPGACASLDDDAAAAMDQHLMGTHRAIKLLQNAEHQANWLATLTKLADQVDLHGLLAGRCCRLLLDDDQIDSEDAARRLSFALSTASDLVQASAWIEGFLKGSGLLVLHDDAIWTVLDRWIVTLNEGAFTTLLPLLRRTFATFTAPERRQMGEKVRQGGSVEVSVGIDGGDRFDRKQAETVLPLIAQLLLRFDQNPFETSERENKSASIPHKRD